MEKHQGKLLREAIQAKQYTQGEVATLLGEEAEKLSGQMEEMYVDPLLLFAVGEVIGHDFTKELPSLATHPLYTGSQPGKGGSAPTIALLQQRYYKLLSRYNGVIKYLLSLAREEWSPELRSHIRSFLATLDSNP